MTGLGGSGVTVDGVVDATTGLASGNGVSLMTSGAGAGASLAFSFLPNQPTGLSLFNRLFFCGFGSAGCNATAGGEVFVTGAKTGCGAGVVMS